MKKFITAVTILVASLFAFVSLGCNSLSDAQKEALADSGLSIAKSFGKAAANYYISEWLLEDAPDWAEEPTRAFLFSINATFEDVSLTAEETDAAIEEALLALDPTIQESVRDQLVLALEDAATKTAGDTAGGTADAGAIFLSQTAALVKRE